MPVRIHFVQVFLINRLYPDQPHRCWSAADTGRKRISIQRSLITAFDQTIHSVYIQLLNRQTLHLGILMHVTSLLFSQLMINDFVSRMTYF